MKSVQSRHRISRPRRQRPLVVFQSRKFQLILMTVFIAYLTLFASILLPQLYSIFGYSSTITVPEVLRQVNQQRKAAGLEPLKLNDALSAAAQAKARNMMENSYWSHNSPSGVEPWDFIDQAGYDYQKAGENLARNFSATPDMITAWLDSPTHRENLLGKDYEDTGIAVLQGEMDGVPTTLVVQMFANPAFVLSNEDIKEITDKDILTDDQLNNSKEDLLGDTSSPRPGFEPYAGSTQEEENLLLGTNVLYGSDQPFLTRSRLLLIGAGLMTLSLIMSIWRDRKAKRVYGSTSSKRLRKYTLIMYLGVSLLVAVMIFFALS